MIEHRTLRSTGLALAGVGGGWLIITLPSLVPKLLGAPPLKGAAAIAAVTALVLIGELWCLGFATLMHRSFDEFQRERAKSAWYWGGGVGLVASAPIAAFIGMGGLRLIDPTLSTGRPLANAFMLGYLLPSLCLGIGYVLASLWARQKKS
jgi:hypothetical protein